MCRRSRGRGRARFESRDGQLKEAAPLNELAQPPVELLTLAPSPTSAPLFSAALPSYWYRSPWYGSRVRTCAFVLPVATAINAVITPVPALRCVI